MSTKSKATPTVDPLVADPNVCRELSICPMTMHRWDHDPAMHALGWPLAVKINRRKFRSRAALDVFKQNLVERAIKDRDVITRKHKGRAA